MFALGLLWKVQKKIKKIIDYSFFLFSLQLETEFHMISFSNCRTSAEGVLLSMRFFHDSFIRPPVFLICAVLPLQLSWGNLKDADPSKPAQSTLPQDKITKLQHLYHTGEKAFKAKDYATAANCYADILEQMDRTLIDATAQTELSLKLAIAQTKLGDFAHASKTIQEIDFASLPQPLFLRAYIVKAEIDFQEGRLIDAYTALKELNTHISAYEWPSEDATFLAHVEESLNEHFEKKIMKGERAFESGLYSDAIPFYQDVFTSIRQGDYPDAIRRENAEIYSKVRYRLAQSYYLEGAYPAVINTLSGHQEVEYRGSQDLKEVQKGAFYLLAISYRQLEQYEAAIEQYQKYLSLGDRDVLAQYAEAQWELGYCYYKIGQFTKAKRYLTPLASTLDNRRVSYLSKLYLIRMSLQEGDLIGSLDKLDDLDAAMADDDPLHYELAFLRGETLFHLGDYAKAADYYTQAIPQHNRRQASWYAQTLMNMGWCFLKLADDAQKSEVVQVQYFDKAESAFKKLLAHTQDEKTYLTLAKVYLARGHCLNDQASYNMVESLLCSEQTFSSVESEGESLLLRAEAAQSYEKRQLLYKELSTDKYSSTKSYPLGWYYKGISTVEQAVKLKESGKESEVEELFVQAIPALEKAFTLLKERDPAKAGQAKKCQIEALCHSENQENILTAYQICEKFIQEQPEIISKMADPDEVYYLKGFICSKLQDQVNGSQYVAFAEESLKKVVNGYPKGRFAAISLKMLGTIQFHQKNYEEAQKSFLTLACQYPSSPQAGEAWFWASECGDWLRQDPSVIRSYREKVFSLYPSSHHADEAYFKFYTYAEYLQGDEKALKHLQTMGQTYPNSPYMVVANYLIGLDYKRDRVTRDGKSARARDLIRAGEAFEAGVSVFDFCYQNHQLPIANLDYFVTVRYRALMERASVHFTIAEESAPPKQQIYFEYAERAFAKIIADFTNPQNTLALHLARGESYPRILEESQFGLAKLYYQSGKDAKAEAVLNQMLEKYRESGILRGYYLSRVWYQQAQIAMKRKDYELAFTHLEKSEETASGKILSTDERLDLWIQQGQCCIAMGQNDRGMLILSQVINEDAVSQQRIKAMYLRGMHYAEQGKHEQAVKQLEAVAQKNGEWAMKAKEKLDQDYGYK